MAHISFGSYLDNQPQGSNQFDPFDNNFGNNGASDPLAALAEAIPGGGVPGQDYPILASVPDTGFTCKDKIPGYYADTAQEARCQVFHICQADYRKDSFLCPNGTVFNQQYFVCDWWFHFDCYQAEQFFGLNAEIGKVTNNGNSGNYGSKSNNTPNNNGRNGNNGNGNKGAGNGSNGNNIQKPSQLYQSPN